MSDQGRTNQQLVEELADLRQRLAVMEARLAQGQQAEADQQKINNSLPVLVATAGVDGYYKEVNAAFERILGWSEQESLSRPFLEFIHPDDRQVALETFGQLKSGEPVADFVDRNICKDGSLRWINWNVIPLLDRGIVFGIGQAITERKQAEEQIQTSLHLQSTISSLLLISLESTSLDQVFQRTLDLLFSVPWLKLMSKGAIYLLEEDSDTLALKAQTGVPEELLASCSRVPLGKCLCGQAATARKIVFSDRVGQRHETQCSASIPHGHYCVPIQSDHRLYGVITVTLQEGHTRAEEEEFFLSSVGQILAGTIERWRVRERLLESERRFRAIFDQAYQFIGLMTPDGTLVEANKSALDFAGVEAKDVLGKPFWETVWWTHSAELRDRLRRAVGRAASGEFVRFEAFHPAPDGSRHYVDVSLKPVKDDAGNVYLLIPEGRDITDRKRAEKQISASLREKEILLKEVHHRVKNNMQVISSLFNLQSHHIEDDRAREIFQDMRGRVTSMAMVHEQLYKSPDLASVDFAAHVRSLVSYLFRAYGDASGAVVFREDFEGVDLTLNMAIPCGLIINELVSNSLKYAFPDGKKGEIHVGLRFVDNRFTLVIVDNGVGLPADMDFRATDTLGLQVVTALVKQLDGKIELDSRGGTAFKITFSKSD